jgi:hypothetical protein
MTRFWHTKRVGTLVIPMLVALAVSPVVRAQGDEFEPEPNSALSFSAGVDLSTAYYYNGIPQIDQGLVTWPWVELGIQLCETIGVTFGQWNSLHNDVGPRTDTTPGAAGSGGSSNPWYESDFYTGISFALPAGFEFGITYVNLHSPNFGGEFSEELQFNLSFDDSEHLEEFSLSPYVQISQELDAGSDFLGRDGHEGTLLLIGIEPGTTVLTDSDYPISLSLPAVIGINLDDYYETGAKGARVDNDDTFGYADIAVAASLPLSFVPDQYGSWSFGAAFHFLILGDSAQQIGKLFGVSHDFSDLEVYAQAGITVEM